MKVKRICLWSGPRNISTALMYSFAQRADCKVVDEPLYAHYLSNSEAKNYHPGSEEIMATMENDGAKVICDLINFDEKPVLFIKNMTHHLIKLNKAFLNNFTNVILTRAPKEMLTSFVKQIENPKMVDVGYAAHLQLFKHLKQINNEPIILDSRKVLENSAVTLKKLCSKIGIDFDEKMLKWKKGAIKEDGIWSKYWYKSVHNSEGFLPYQTKNENVPAHLKDLYQSCQKIYDELIQYSI